MANLDLTTSRRKFLQATAATGAIGAVGSVVGEAVEPTKSEAAIPVAKPETKITKSVCHQCPARCGIDVYTTNGRVHAIYGSLDHPHSNGKLCPKGFFGTYILYDPDRFTGPMKRTNPNKGRNEDPKFVPISWDEALDTIAERLNRLRDKGEAHRFALVFGRGWGASDAGALLPTFSQLYVSPNVRSPSFVALCRRQQEGEAGARRQRRLQRLRLSRHQLHADLWGGFPRSIPTVEQQPADLGVHPHQEPENQGDDGRRSALDHRCRRRPQPDRSAGYRRRAGACH